MRLNVLSGVRAQFFSVLNNNPLQRCTAVCLPKNLLKDVWVSFAFWQIWINLLQAFLYMFYVGINFQLIWVVAGSAISAKTVLNCVRNCQAIFLSGCTILHSYHQWRRVHVAPHAFWNWSVFWFCSHSNRVGVVLSHFEIFLLWHMTSDILSHTYLSSYIFCGKTFVQIFCQFLIGLLEFMLLSCMNSLYVFSISPLSDRCFTNLSL